MKFSEAVAIVDAIDDYIKIKVQMELDLQKSNNRGYLEKNKMLGEARDSLLRAILVT